MRRSHRLRGTTDCPIAVYYSRPLTTTAHWHPEVEILITTAGSIQCRLEDRKLNLKKGDIAIFNPNQAHILQNASPDHKYIDVIFSPEVIAMPQTHIFQKNFVGPLTDGRLQLPNLIQPGHPAHEDLRALLSQMPQGNLYQDESKFFRYARVVALCSALQPYCTLTQNTDRRQFPEDRTVRSAMIYIHNSYSRPLTLENIATQVHLHPNYLSAIFKAQTGHTVTEHISMTRVDAAKFILRRDVLPMSRIAELTGFPSERSFYRQFKKITGMTPKAYQKEQTRPPEPNQSLPL